MNKKLLAFVSNIFRENNNKKGLRKIFGQPLFLDRFCYCQNHKGKKIKKNQELTARLISILYCSQYFLNAHHPV
ncbi:hypothetical protein VUJ46_17840 [Chryseobacterium sp. MYb264]|uniref:hypothetical protein n=1 Tax=Chryseobacterium sp. MYb264 TaxID=2745153 RepID=UPI002E156F8D|nr:hypothetical protein VUJ46_17840 [Chryseobacterium sp. MYb264]